MNHLSLLEGRCPRVVVIRECQSGHIRACVGLYGEVPVCFGLVVHSQNQALDTESGMAP